MLRVRKDNFTVRYALRLMHPGGARFTDGIQPTHMSIRLLTATAFAAAMMTASAFDTEYLHAKCCVAAKNDDKAC